FGWFLPILGSRIGTTGTVATRLAVRPPSVPAGRARWWLGTAAGVGLADVLGLAAFTRGIQISNASIVTAASATFAVIPVIGGLTVFGERPAPSQVIGVAFVVGGLVLLGLVS